MDRNSFNLASLFEKENLAPNGGNYEDWIRTPRYVLRSAKKEYVLDQPLGEYPAPGAPQDVINVFISHKNDFSVVQSVVLSCMDQALQKHYQQLSITEVLYHKDPAEIHKMTKAMDECKIAEVGEQGVRIVDYYLSINARKLIFPRHRRMI